MRSCVLLHVSVYLYLLQYLMEGSYNKIFLSRGNVPADSYSFFIDELVHTIRYVHEYEKRAGDWCTHLCTCACLAEPDQHFHCVAYVRALGPSRALVQHQGGISPRLVSL